MQNQADRPYLIYDAADLNAFRDLVNGGQTDICARLEADIVLNENFDHSKFSSDSSGALTYNGGEIPAGFEQWVPVGRCFTVTDFVAYSGVFDGNGHSVSAMYINTDQNYNYYKNRNWALFAYCSETAVVKNLRVENSYVRNIVRNNFNAGLVCDNSGLIKQCGFSGTVINENTSTAGLCAINDGRIEDCYNQGNVYGTDVFGAGGLCNGNNGSLLNSYNTGAVDAGEKAGAIAKSNYGTVKDCIYLEGSAPTGVYDLGLAIITRIWQKSEAAFKSGEAAYFLNGETSDGELSFGQLIGSDEYPVFHTPANTVYKTDDGYANAAAKVGDDYYLTLNEAFDAASDIKELGGAPVSAENPVTIEVLRDITLDKSIYVQGSYGSLKDWHVRLTSSAGKNFVVTRNPETVKTYMIEMRRNADCSLVLENITLDGGALSSDSETSSILIGFGDVTLNSGAVLQNNRCKSSGGAIDMNEGTLTMNEGARIVNNTASGSGGGVIVWSDFVMNGGTISGNRAQNGSVYGGGVYIGGSSSFTMNGGSITGNYCDYRSGGLAVFDPANNNVILKCGSIEGNYHKASSTKPEENDIYMEFSAVLNIGGSIRVGVIQLLNSACRLEVVSPLSETVGVNYVTEPSAESVMAVKSSAYSSDESLDKTRFVLKGIDSMCLWLSDNGDEITINNHSGAATCVDDAVCSNCGKVHEQAKGHTLVPTAAKVPTCTEPGNTAYWQCTVCGKYFSDENAQTEITLADTVISAAGHTLVPTAAKDPTCTEPGNTAYWQCTVCGKYFSDENAQNEVAREDTETAPAGHKFANGKCAVCGTADPSYKAPASQENDKGADTSLKSPATGAQGYAVCAYAALAAALAFTAVVMLKKKRKTQ